MIYKMAKILLLHKMKKYFQQVFLNTEYYTLSMSPVFLQKNNEDYETVMKACKTLIY
mgnify:CR=1 FL=1